MFKKIFYKQPEKTEPAEEAAVASTLWSSPIEFDEKWKRRISTMASYITKPCPVADFGCGMMWLETCLPPNCTYIPLDYVGGMSARW